MFKELEKIDSNNTNIKDKIKLEFNDLFTNEEIEAGIYVADKFYKELSELDPNSTDFENNFIDVEVGPLAHWGDRKRMLNTFTIIKDKRYTKMTEIYPSIKNIKKTFEQLDQFKAHYFLATKK